LPRDPTAGRRSTRPVATLPSSGGARRAMPPDATLHHGAGL
jgi:hypothetical protein